MARTAKRRHEKHISEYRNGGSHYFQVNISKQVDGHRNTFTKSVNCADYESDADAFAAAIMIRDEALRKLQSGRLVSHFPTVEEIWQKKFDLIPCSLKTRHNHEYFYKLGISHLADKRLDKVSAAEVQMSLNEYARTHTQDMTSKLLSCWRQIYRAARLMGYDLPDRTQQVILPKSRVVTAPKPQDLTREDFERFCEALLEYNSAMPEGRFMSQLVWYLIQIEFYCGLRTQETLALRRDDIVFDRKLIRVRRSVGSTETEARQIVALKTPTSLRDVPYPEALEPILRQLLEFRDGDWLFTDSNGQFLEINDLSAYINHVSKKCKIPFNLYRLRHLYSTELTKVADLRTVQDLMGHASQTQTLDYARSSEEDRRKAVEKRK